MKAIAIYAYGGTEVFTEIDADTPVARPGHVIIDVRATSVNPVDTKIRKGSEGTAGLKFQPFFTSTWPGSSVRSEPA